MTVRTPSRRVPWLVLGFVVVGALIVGSRSDGPQTREDRVQAIAATIKCPECSGQSVASSSGRSAKAIRTDIAERLERGQSADQIRDYYAGRFGEELLLTPSGSGTASLVWIVPVVVFVDRGGRSRRGVRALAGRRRCRAADEDRALVAAALADPHGEGAGR